MTLRDIIMHLRPSRALACSAAVSKLSLRRFFFDKFLTNICIKMSGAQWLVANDDLLIDLFDKLPDELMSSDDPEAHARVDCAIHLGDYFKEKAIEEGKYGMKLTQETEPANSP